MKKNYLYLDTETTNTDPKTGAIVEIGAICNNKEFHTFVKPHSGAKISQDAMDINDISLTSLQSAPTHTEAYKMLCEFMDQFVDKYNPADKLILAGYNVKFDDDFLREFFLRAGDRFLGSYRWPALYDVQVPAIAYLQTERSSMVNFRLGTVAKQLGIDTSKYQMHNALDDIKITVEIDELING